ncbi:MAG: DUF1634 domain-containing protein [Planctomycetaceae bacterium]|nr:DUF1634 domain-containing protein [Planctomycetaceae bacterium]
MSHPPPLPRDIKPPFRRVEIFLSYLLRTGVALSMMLVLTGVVLLFVRHPDDLSQARNLPGLVAPGAEFPHTVGQVIRQFDGVSGRAVASLGLLVLIATPVLRVAVSVVAFALERDWTYVALTMLVLILLLLSFRVGGAG